MKKVFALMLLCMIPGIGFAQSSAKQQDPDDVKVMEATWRFGYSWSKESSANNLGTGNQTSSSSGGPIRSNEQGQGKTDTNIIPLDTRIAVKDTTYQNAAIVTFHNDGSKQVKSMSYDFVFLRAETGAELLRYKFHNRVKINAGETTKIVSEIVDKQAERYRPVGVGSDLSKEGRVDYKVILSRIEYADGTFWQSN